MSKMIAYCGLICSNCPSFLATKNNDNAAREKTSALLAEKFGLDVKPEDINCDGCLTVGERLLDFCRTCGIRQCCSERGLENCALCDEQPCEKLISFHKFSPDAKACFDALKREIE
ncbi:DUF3795 domain-containing protein [Desulfoscipio sp. XC116]|uniref:DUF3795 domain-containing protein n=1 Tax=Desulfoscipio sp. XC116 TaxID=3144975 RepID=UPI00325BC7B2